MDANMYNALHAVMNYLNAALLSLLQLKYQHKEISPFEEHNTIMLLYIMTSIIYSTALIALLLLAHHQLPETPCLATLKHISLLSGALACDLLLLILFPLFGYFLLAFGGVLALLRSYQKIMGQGTDQGSGGGVPSNHNSTGQGSGGGVPSNHNSTDQGSGDHKTAPIANV